MAANIDDSATGFRSRFIESVTGRFFQPVDARPLVWFRIVFGGTLLYWSVHYYLADLIDIYYVKPRFHFTWAWFSGIEVLDERGIYAVFATIAFCSACVMLGAAYRITSTILGLSFCYLFLLDKAYYQNHYYLLSMVGLLMPLLPANKAFSIDALVRPSKSCRMVPGWSMFLVRFAVALPYVFGGIAKLTPDWLAGQPARMMLAGRTWMPVIGQWFTEDWMVTTFIWGGILLDLLIVPALLWKPTRLIALIFGLGFHISNAFMFHIGVFPWFMILATLVFLPSGFFETIFRPVWRKRSAAVKYSPPAAVVQRFITVSVLLFVVVNCVVPFRHWICGGKVEWNEHGHHFSWRMKLRGKQSALRLAAYDPESGANMLVNPQRWLTPFQVNRMARDPKMVHQFSRFLKSQFAKDGYPQTEIHATVMCSLNGRKPQLLIDPEVDLGSLPIPKNIDWANQHTSSR